MWKSPELVRPDSVLTVVSIASASVPTPVSPEIARPFAVMSLPVAASASAMFAARLTAFTRPVVVISPIVKVPSAKISIAPPPPSMTVPSAIWTTPPVLLPVA